jgi:hypothetical protein
LRLEAGELDEDAIVRTEQVLALLADRDETGEQRLRIDRVRRVLGDRSQAGLSAAIRALDRIA